MASLTHSALTVEEFAATAACLHASYIAEERQRMAALSIMLRQHGPTSGAYKREALTLALHPLTGREISARLDELTRMEAAIPRQFCPAGPIAVAYAMFIEREA